MHRTSLLAAALAAAALASPAAAFAADEAAYDVTFEATMTERWSFDERSSDDCELTGAMCTRATVGIGDAKLSVRSRRPTRVLVMRGFRGRPPLIGVGTGEGIPLVGSSVRRGSIATDYAGPWDAANPDVRQPDGGCGKRTVRASITFSWRGSGKLAAMAQLPDAREDCPDGLPIAADWAGGDPPSFGDVLAAASPRKFLGTPQLTVRGRRTWTGSIPTVERTSRTGSYAQRGQHQVTWQWEATFRRARR